MAGRIEDTAIVVLRDYGFVRLNGGESLRFYIPAVWTTSDID